MGYLLCKAKDVSDKPYYFGGCFFLIGISSYLTSELLFRFPRTRVLYRTLSVVSAVDLPSFTLQSLLDRYGSIAYNTFFVFNPFVALVLLITCTYLLSSIFQKGNRKIAYFLYTWLCASLL